MRLGEQIQRAREHAGVTRRELADAVGRKQTTIYNWETGIHQPSPSMLTKLRHALQVDENFDPLPPELEDDIAGLSNAELVSRLHLVAAEVARRLGTGGVTLAPGTEERLQNTPGTVRVNLPDADRNRHAGTKEPRQRHAK